MKVCKGLHLQENECIVVTKERHQKPRESCSAFVMQLVTGAYIAQGAMHMGIHSESPFDESLEEPHYVGSVLSTFWALFQPQRAADDIYLWCIASTLPESGRRADYRRQAAIRI